MNPQPLDLSDLEKYPPNLISEITKEIKYRIKKACEFYMRYMDKPYTFLSEQWERAQKEKIKEKFYTKGYGWSLYDYNEWLFRLAFKDVLRDDEK